LQAFEVDINSQTMVPNKIEVDILTMRRVYGMSKWMPGVKECKIPLSLVRLKFCVG